MFVKDPEKIAAYVDAARLTRRARFAKDLARVNGVGYRAALRAYNAAVAAEDAAWRTAYAGSGFRDRFGNVV